MAACGDQYEAMPDRFLKPQGLPHMKDDACRVNDATCREKPKAQARESHCNRRVKDRTTPTEEQVENNGQAIEATGQQQLEGNADNRHQPDTDEETVDQELLLRNEYLAADGDAALGNLLRDPNWLLGSGFCRSRCWLGYHDRIGNRLRNIDGFRAGLMSTNHARPP